MNKPENQDAIIIKFITHHVKTDIQMRKIHVDQLKPHGEKVSKPQPSQLAR